MGTDTKKTIVIRADARKQIGHGHLMRCLALAQACKTAGYSPVFLSNCDSRELQDRIEAEGFTFKFIDRFHPDSHDLKTTLNILGETEAEWLVLDGYLFDFQYQKAIRKSGYKLLVIDDLADKRKYDADILLNQNIYANELSYSCNSDAILLLGGRYTLLRSEFTRLREKNKKIPLIAKKILVVIGGSDPHCLAHNVVNALEKLEIKGLQIAVAASGECKAKLGTLAKEINQSGKNIILFDNPSKLRSWMEWADLAISGAGSTCYELAYLGIPGLMIICAENQKLIASALEKRGVSINLGWYTDINSNHLLQVVKALARDQKTRSEMIKSGQSLIDGQGSARVVQWMQDHILSIRKADQTDCKQIFEWSNDPVTRSVSFSTEFISWETHKKWFKTKLSDPNSIIYIASDNNQTPLGLVRFQLEGELAIISININPFQRGKGFGSKILRFASKRVFQQTQVTQINAYIKQENTASIRVFLKAGFIQQGNISHEEKEPLLFSLRKDF